MEEMIKKTPIININTGQIIKEWHTDKPQRLSKLTQENLETYFKSQPGWIIKDSLSETRRDNLKNKYGIYVFAQYKNGYGLSIVAGEGRVRLYCSPNVVQDEYNSVEVGLTKGNLLANSDQRRKFFKHTVEGHSSLNEVKKLKEYVETL